MTTVQQIYEEMQRIAPLALAESWDNLGLLVDCGGEVSRVLVTLDITPEVVEEAARKGCGLIVSHHPVIFSPLKKLSGQDVAFQLVKSGISAICMHTNLDAAEGGVNEVLAGFFGMREMEAFAEGCDRVGDALVRLHRCRRHLCPRGRPGRMDLKESIVDRKNYSNCILAVPALPGVSHGSCRSRWPHRRHCIPVFPQKEWGKCSLGMRISKKNSIMKLIDKVSG